MLLALAVVVGRREPGGRATEPGIAGRREGDGGGGGDGREASQPATTPTALAPNCG